jgi:hypothetical protein
LHVIVSAKVFVRGGGGGRGERERKKKHCVAFAI